MEKKLEICCLTTLAWLICSTSLLAQSSDPFAEIRREMVKKYCIDEGIDNRRVLEAMAKVPRHEFVPTPSKQSAYRDAALPIGHQQTISPPFIVAYMTQCIDPQPTDKVLEIGTGSGYQAAVLSELCKEVYSIEIVEPLGKQAARTLRDLRYENVQTKVGDGYLGWPEHAPFDRIIVTCSPEDVPRPLINQLAEGGRMIIPLGERYQQVFYLFKKEEGKLVREKLIPTLFVPMTGISETNRKEQPNPARPELVNGGFEIDENEDGRVDHWHYQRQATMTKGDAPQGDCYIAFENSEPGRIAQILQGIPIDGRLVKTFKIRLTIKLDNVRSGRRSFERPAVMIHFYDAIRRPVKDVVVGPWLGTRDWSPIYQTVLVPEQAREAIVRVGMNGATGQFWVDDLQISAR